MTDQTGEKRSNTGTEWPMEATGGSSRSVRPIPHRGELRHQLAGYLRTEGPRAGTRTDERAGHIERDGKEAIRNLLLETSTGQDITDNTCRLLVDAYGWEGAWLVCHYNDG